MGSSSEMISTADMYCFPNNNELAGEYDRIKCKFVTD
jgi:hypothetical protein